MPKYVPLGERVEWDDTSNAAIFMNAEAAGALMLRLQEYVSTQTTYSFEIENNAGTTKFGILGTAAAVDMVDVASDCTTGDIFDIDGNSLTTGDALDVGSTSQTTGSLIRLTGNSSDTSARNVLNVIQDHASATGAVGLNVQQDSTAGSVVIDHNGVTGKALYIDAESTTQTAGIVDIDVNTLTTGTGIDLGNASSLTSGILVNLVADSTNTGAFTLLKVVNDNTAATGCRPIFVQQDAAGDAVVIDNNAAQSGIFVDHDDTGSEASIYVDRDGNSASRISGIKVDSDNAGAGGVAGIDLSSFAADEPLFVVPADTNSAAGTLSGQFAVRMTTTTYYVNLYTQG